MDVEKVALTTLPRSRKMGENPGLLVFLKSLLLVRHTGLPRVLCVCL